MSSLWDTYIAAWLVRCQSCHHACSNKRSLAKLLALFAFPGYIQHPNRTIMIITMCTSNILCPPPIDNYYVMLSLPLSLYRKLRSNTHSQILINMSVALAAIYIFFMIGGHVTAIPILCGFSSAFLHYFLLVFFAWTAVEAIWLYLKLVRVFGIQSYEHRFIAKLGIPVWSKFFYFSREHDL